MLSSVFGDIARFAVEIRYDLERSKEFPWGLFFYWIGGRRIGQTVYANLTNVQASMTRMRKDCGHRDGGRLCELPPAAICRWWKAIMWDDDPNMLGFDVENLPPDVARFNLAIQNVNDGGEDVILLLACGDSGMLLHARDHGSEPLVIKDDIQRLEDPIRQAWDFLDSLHRRLGID